MLIRATVIQKEIINTQYYVLLCVWLASLTLWNAHSSGIARFALWDWSADVSEAGVNAVIGERLRNRFI